MGLYSQKLIGKEGNKLTMQENNLHSAKIKGPLKPQTWKGHIRHLFCHNYTQNKSSPKSFGKSMSLPLTAENALVCCMCYLYNLHCRQDQLLSRRYASTSIPHQSLDWHIGPE